MRLLLDQNLPVSLAGALALRAGWDVVHVRSLGMQSSRDVEILARAVADGRVVVSADTDFADPSRHVRGCVAFGRPAEGRFGTARRAVGPHAGRQPAAAAGRSFQRGDGGHHRPEGQGQAPPDRLMPAPPADESAGWRSDGPPTSHLIAERRYTRYRRATEEAPTAGGGEGSTAGGRLDGAATAAGGRRCCWVTSG